MTPFYQCKGTLFSGIVQRFQFSHGGREKHSETTEVGLEAFSDALAFKTQTEAVKLLLGIYFRVHTVV